MKKIVKILVILILTIVPVACESFLETDIPKDQVGQSIVFNDDRTAEAALTYVYTQMRNSGFFAGSRLGMGYLLACYTDEIEVINPQSTNHRHFYEGSVVAGNAGVKTIWDNTYKQIYTVNSVLEGLNNSSGMSKEVRTRLQGEALAVRGILHFYLSQTFGSVPYVTITDYNINKKIEKISETQIMQLAVSDLEQAQQHLSDLYPSAEKIRINRSVVRAFLARMYLYQQKWDKALSTAQLLINQAEYELEPLDKVFLKESRSAIWQLKPDAEGRNTAEGTEYIFTSVPAPQGRLSLFLVNSFETGDLRMENWIKKVGTTTEDYCAYKYKVRGASSPTKEYSVVIRLEEMYLIAAEAAMELADFAAFNSYISVLRMRAGLDVVHVANVTEGLEVLMRERRAELFCEFGHRFYDLKRRNRLNDLLSVKPQWRSHFSLLPLPDNELLLNPGLLPQNIGY